MIPRVGVRVGAFRAHPPISTQTRDTRLQCDRVPCAQGESACSGSLLRDLQEVVGHCGRSGMLRVTPLGKAVTCVEQVLCDSAAISSRKKAHSAGHRRTAARATSTTTSRVSLTLSLSHSHSLTLTHSHSLSHTLSHSHTLSLSHSLECDTHAQCSHKHVSHK